MNVTLPVLDRVEASDREEFREAVLAGLARSPRAIPPKFLYDARGSELFDAICELPEYYLTRTETGILADCAPELARRAGPGCALVEFGSGSSVKTRLLLDAMPDLAAYVPIDVSRHHLDATAAKLRRDYPRLRVEPVCADYMVLDSLPADRRSATWSPRTPRRSCAARVPCWATGGRWSWASTSGRTRAACTTPTMTRPA